MATGSGESSPLQRRAHRYRVGAWTIGLLLFAAFAGGVKLAGAIYGASAQELSPDLQRAVSIAVSTASAPQTTAIASAADVQVDEFAIHIPDGARLPLTAVVALHGMGGNGPGAAGAIMEHADAQGWAVVAPTIRYGDWTDPGQLRIEDPANIDRIARFLDRLPDELGYSVRRQVLLYGFSRGGQTAGRFALAYPERVAGAALASSGTYTIPVASMDDASGRTLLPFPYGVGDFPELFGRPFDQAAFARIPFWIGVGAQDVNPDDVPDEWDRYIGRQRVQRAEEYAAWLRRTGAEVQVQVFPGTGHGQTSETCAAAMRFLASINRG